MKKIIRILLILFLIFLMASSVLSSSMRFCPEGKSGVDAGDYAYSIAWTTLFMSIPVANLNYSMFREGKGLYACLYDGLLAASLAYVYFEQSSPADNDEWMNTSKRIFAGIILLSMGYSIIFSVEAGRLKDNGSQSRANWGIALFPLMSLNTMGALNFITPCKQIQKQEDGFLYPVIGPEYAGLNCNIKF